MSPTTAASRWPDPARERTASETPAPPPSRRYRNRRTRWSCRLNSRAGSGGSAAPLCAMSLFIRFDVGRRGRLAFRSTQRDVTQPALRSAAIIDQTDARRQLRSQPAAPRQRRASGLMMSGRPAWNRRGPTMPTMARGPTAITVIAVIAVIAASRWRDVVATAPAAVSGNVRFIVAADVADSHRSTVAVRTHHAHTGGDQAEQQQPGGADPPRHGFNAHFGSTLVSVSDHSITATAAPAGSTITAIFPPWRST